MIGALDFLRAILGDDHPGAGCQLSDLRARSEDRLGEEEETATSRFGKRRVTRVTWLVSPGLSVGRMAVNRPNVGVAKSQELPTTLEVRGIGKGAGQRPLCGRLPNGRDRCGALCTVGTGPSLDL